ncbi:DUF2058 domain-containing protein [Immundisolibacter sp.]
MANPLNQLQAQLLKAGLVKTDQIRKAAQQTRDVARRSPAPDPAAEQLRQAQQRKADSDRAHNRQQQDQRERKAQAAQIRQLIESQRLDRSGGEAAYQFIEAGKIRKIHLHEAQRVQVVKGMLAVVRQGRNFELVPPATAHKIAERDPTLVLVLNVESKAQAQAAPDPYADYPVPDDLMW